jgi:hypothetical protein
MYTSGILTQGVGLGACTLGVLTAGGGADSCVCERESVCLHVCSRHNGFLNLSCAQRTLNHCTRAHLRAPGEIGATASLTRASDLAGTC